MICAAGDLTCHFQAFLIHLSQPLIGLALALFATWAVLELMTYGGRDR